MDWQETAVALIGAALVWIIVRRLLCRGRNKARGGCAACSRDCPLRELGRKRKDRS